MNLKAQKELEFFHEKTDYLRKFENAVKRLSRSRHIKLKTPTETHSPEDCRQAIFSSSSGIYCGLLKEQVDKKICRNCPLFDFEPPEYKLFIRI